MQKEYLLWIDIETTGLNPQHNEIIEIAYVLTDFSVKEIYEENEYVLKPIISYENVLLQMDNWCKTQHSNSGLLTKVKTALHSVYEIEYYIIDIINKYKTDNSIIYLAGNSVHFDKMFINHYMKNLSKCISHRILDVSSFSIICKNLNYKVYDKRPLKKYKHTALSDIWESINEYIYYLENFIKLQITKNKP